MQLCLQTAFFKSRLYGFGGRSWFHSQICHCCGKQSAYASQLKSCGLQGLGPRGPPLLLSNCNWKQLFQSTAWEIRNSCPQLPNPLGFYQAWYNPLEIRNMKIMMKPNEYFLVSKFCSAWIPSKPVITVTHQLIREQFLPRDRSSRKAGPKGQAGSVQWPAFCPTPGCANCLTAQILKFISVTSTVSVT